MLDTNENMKCLNIRTFVQSAVNTIKNSTLTLYTTWLSMFDWVSMSVLGFVRVLNDVAQSSKQSLMSSWEFDRSENSRETLSLWEIEITLNLQTYMKNELCGGDGFFGKKKLAENFGLTNGLKWPKIGGDISPASLVFRMYASHLT